MTETLIALILAHLLADFVFQPSAWVARKDHWSVALGHGAVVWATAALCLGSLHPVLLVLTGLHMMTDALKARVRPGAGPFLVDQGVHLSVIVGVAAAFPGLWAAGEWPPLLPTDLAPWVMPAAVLVSGAIATIRAGGFAVGLLMSAYPIGTMRRTLPQAGRMIGWLERGLIFLFVLTGQPLGIGFLIAAKSILRFDTARRDQKASEYVIIGTLASFGWALGLAHLTAWGLTRVMP